MTTREVQALLAGLSEGERAVFNRSVQYAMGSNCEETNIEKRMEDMPSTSHSTNEEKAMDVGKQQEEAPEEEQMEDLPSKRNKHKKKKKKHSSSNEDGKESDSRHAKKKGEKMDKSKKKGKKRSDGAGKKGEASKDIPTQEKGDECEGSEQPTKKKDDKSKDAEFTEKGEKKKSSSKEDGKETGSRHAKQQGKKTDKSKKKGKKRSDDAGKKGEESKDTPTQEKGDECEESEQSTKKKDDKSKNAEFTEKGEECTNAQNGKKRRKSYDMKENTKSTEEEREGKKRSREDKEREYGAKKKRATLTRSDVEEAIEGALQKQKEQKKKSDENPVNVPTKKKPAPSAKNNVPGGKGKALLSKGELFKQHQKEEELRNLKEAIRRSLVELKERKKDLKRENKERYGIADSSDSNYDTPSAKLSLSEDEGDDHLSNPEDGSEPELSLSEDKGDEHLSNLEGGSDNPLSPVFVQQAAEMPVSEVDKSTSSGTDGDVEEDFVMVDKPKKKRKRRQRPPETPGSDNDPDPPEPGVRPYPPDRFGWTRSGSEVTKQPFGGPTPFGPTFQPPAQGRLEIKPAVALFYFLQFFSLRLFSKITEWTNKNLCNAGKLEATVEEIKAWFGIRMVMGLVKLPSTDIYWSSHPGYNNELICRTMTKTRFDILSQHLACADPDSNLENIEDDKHRYLAMRAHPLYPLQKVWDSIVRRCRRKYNPAVQLAIDEAMIKYKGFKAAVKKFFLPLKPIRCGFKIYTLAESCSGYICNFMVHKFTEGGAKMKEITLQVAEPFLDKYHHIFTDKLYTGIELAKELLARPTYLTGAIKSNSKEWPVDFSSCPAKNPRGYQKIKKMPKTPRGTMYFRQNGSLTAVLWKDSRVVSLLSSAHSGFRNKATDTVQRKVREEGSNKQKETPINAPPQAIDYTKNMGGVDRADQLRAYYSCSRKSQKWWKKILYFLVDICRVNAYICFKHHHLNQERSDEPPCSINDDLDSADFADYTSEVEEDEEDSEENSENSDDDDEGACNKKRKRDPKHSAFTMAIAEGLIGGYSHGKPRRHMLQSTTPVQRQNAPSHKSIRMEVSRPKQCMWCRMQEKKTEKGYVVHTRYGCETCNVHLCRGQCFIRFHNAEGVDVSCSSSDED